MKSLTERIKQKAKELGFGLVGITPVLPPPHAAFFLTWLKDGYAGEMEYLRRTAELRLEPEKLLPGAKSAVMVGLNYVPRVQAESEEPTRGAFATYAWGEDYHEVIRAKLNALLAWIKEEMPEIEGRACIDSAPVLERDLAWQAGLGWFGKNTCLINTRQGSYFFIGSLLLTIELEYDHLAFGGCGSCTKCLDACPTGALLEPYKLDSTRCISYLTIEQKGGIPENLRDNLGNWVFGCDICQAVCPFNQPRENAPERACPTDEPAFEARPSTLAPPLLDLLRLSQEQFSEAYRKSAVKRAKRRGLIRNACVAAGNSGDPSLIPALETLAESGDELIAEHARWAIEKLKAI